MIRAVVSAASRRWDAANAANVAGDSSASSRVRPSRRADLAASTIGILESLLGDDPKDPTWSTRESATLDALADALRLGGDASPSSASISYSARAFVVDALLPGFLARETRDASQRRCARTWTSALGLCRRLLKAEEGGVEGDDAERLVSRTLAAPSAAMLDAVVGVGEMNHHAAAAVATLFDILAEQMERAVGSSGVSGERSAPTSAVAAPPERSAPAVAAPPERSAPAVAAPARRRRSLVSVSVPATRADGVRASRRVFSLPRRARRGARRGARRATRRAIRRATRRRPPAARALRRNTRRRTNAAVLTRLRPPPPRLSRRPPRRVFSARPSRRRWRPSPPPRSPRPSPPPRAARFPLWVVRATTPRAIAKSRDTARLFSPRSIARAPRSRPKRANPRVSTAAPAARPPAFPETRRRSRRRRGRARGRLRGPCPGDPTARRRRGRDRGRDSRGYPPRGFVSLRGATRGAGGGRRRVARRRVRRGDASRGGVAPRTRGGGVRAGYRDAR